MIRCGDCVYWGAKLVPTGQRSIDAECRRHAPAGDGWLRTRSEDWCGDAAEDDLKPVPMIPAADWYAVTSYYLNDDPEDLVHSVVVKPVVGWVAVTGEGPLGARPVIVPNVETSSLVILMKKGEPVSFIADSFDSEHWAHAVASVCAMPGRVSVSCELAPEWVQRRIKPFDEKNTMSCAQSLRN